MAFKESVELDVYRVREVSSSPAVHEPRPDPNVTARSRTQECTSLRWLTIRPACRKSRNQIRRKQKQQLQQEVPQTPGNADGASCPGPAECGLRSKRSP